VLRMVIRRLFPITIISRWEHRLVCQIEFQEIVVHALETHLNCDVMGYINRYNV